MEDFWQTVTDIGILFLKGLAFVIVFRLVILLFGYQLYIPYLDDLLLWVFDSITTLVPITNPFPK